MIFLYGVSPKGNTVGSEQASAFFETIVQSGRENADAIKKFNQELVQNSWELGRMRDVAAERTGNTTGDVVTVLNAKATVSTELRLTYSTYSRSRSSFSMI